MMMTLKDIRSHLAMHGLSDAVALNCWRVGNNPGIDVIVSKDEWRRFDRCGFGELPGMVSTALGSDDKKRLVMLCDLYALNNDPPPGIQWSHDDRVKGALLGITSCLLLLMWWHKGLRSLLIEKPERLVIATIEEGSVVVQDGQGERMLAFLAGEA